MLNGQRILNGHSFTLVPAIRGVQSLKNVNELRAVEDLIDGS